jgi:hypothetical protein
VFRVDPILLSVATLRAARNAQTSAHQPEAWSSSEIRLIDPANQRVYTGSSRAVKWRSTGAAWTRRSPVISVRRW